MNTKIGFYLIILSFISFRCAPDKEEIISVQTQDDRPNIIVLLIDDMEYSDLGSYGFEINTSNINKLAEEGMMFTNYHTISTCFTTRSMPLTGLDNHLTNSNS